MSSSIECYRNIKRYLKDKSLYDACLTNNIIVIGKTTINDTKT
ncbi:hypothetical protein J5U22_02015 [Saccharolobus shibatae]|uniref:Uncharacterized protein n=1 Tax=Saccharolobus shibatae TaxID=2286 RepID=A0A8F5C208_9CREN|nr:hypothetical protein J5U22_02015 [Saccharolobus shibatae]